VNEIKEWIPHAEEVLLRHCESNNNELTPRVTVGPISHRGKKTRQHNSFTFT